MFGGDVQNRSKSFGDILVGNGKVAVALKHAPFVQCVHQEKNLKRIPSIKVVQRCIHQEKDNFHQSFFHWLAQPLLVGSFLVSLKRVH